MMDDATLLQIRAMLEVPTLADKIARHYLREALAGRQQATELEKTIVDRIRAEIYGVQV